MPTSSGSRASPKRKRREPQHPGKFCQMINGQRGERERSLSSLSSCILDVRQPHWNC
jgi:hypothetical protein